MRMKHNSRELPPIEAPIGQARPDCNQASEKRIEKRKRSPFGHGKSKEADQQQRASKRCSDAQHKGVPQRTWFCGQHVHERSCNTSPEHTTKKKPDQISSLEDSSH